MLRRGLLIAALGALGVAGVSAETRNRVAASPPLIGAPSDCTANAFCALGIRHVYGVDIAKRLTPLAPGRSTYSALRTGKVAIAVAFSTDPQLRDSNLVQLEDDLRMTGADNVVPLARSSVERAYGAPLRRRLNTVSGKLTLSDLRRLNAAVASGEALDDIARRWVSSEGLDSGRASPRSGPPLVFVAQAFPENRLLAHLYAKALSADGYRTNVRLVYGYRNLALDALQHGRGSIMVDYAASLLEHLDRFQGFRSRRTPEVLRLLRTYAATRGLEVYAPSTARNVNVLVTTRATAESLGVGKLSDLRKLAYPRVATLAPPSAASVAAHAFDNTGALAIGAEGPTVEQAQEQLNGLGYGAGGADGVFGEQTRRAVAWFQQENGLERNGVLSRATLRELFATDAKRPSKPLAVPGSPRTHYPPASGNVVYLTFDDGPSTYTASVKALLDRYEMKATFFVVGQNIGLHRDVVQQLARDGFAIGSHTWDHTDLSKASTQRFFTEVDSTQDAIRRTIGKAATCLRPPYGATNSSTRSLAHDRGYKVVLWDVDPQDWSRPGVDAIVSNVLSHTHAGSIVLMHDGGGERGETLAALRQILPALRQRGLTSAGLNCD